MKTRHPMFSLDVLALALLTCLLASVVGLLVISEDGKTLDWSRQLREKTQQIVDGASGTQSAQEHIARRVEILRIDRDQRIAQSEAEELRRNIDARVKIAETTAETIRHREELARLDQDQAARPGRRQIVGNYRGPYILIECLKGYALVYPGKTRLAKKPDDKVVNELIARIDQAQFVVFVVRPQGWYGDSFDSLQPMIYSRIDEKTGRSAFPLEAGASITPYLPPDPNAAAPTTPEPKASPKPATKSHQRSRS